MKRLTRPTVQALKLNLNLRVRTLHNFLHLPRFANIEFNATKGELERVAGGAAVAGAGAHVAKAASKDCPGAHLLENMESPAGMLHTPMPKRRLVTDH